MITWQAIAQLLTAGGAGAFGVALVQAIPAWRKAGPEREGLKTGLELEMIAASKEQVAFLRSELVAMRDEFARSREEFGRTVSAARAENEELTRELHAARAEVSTLRGVVAALHADLGATRTQLGQDHT